MANSTPAEILFAGVEAYLAALPKNQFDALVARTRDPEEPQGDEPAGQFGVDRLAQALDNQKR